MNRRTRRAHRSGGAGWTAHARGRRQCSRARGLGLELISEVQSAIARAIKNPESFTRVRLNPVVRRVLTRRFPYRVFFIARTDAIVVFAVLHAARHDRVWKHRAEHE